MKVLIGFICFLLIQSFAFSQGLEFPKSIDFGDVPIGNIEMANSKTLPLTIKNNTNVDYKLFHIDIIYNYPDSISHSGNVIQLGKDYVYKNFTYPIHISANSSYTLNPFYTSKFVDDISKTGEKLSETFIFYYCREDGTDIRTDTVHTFARSVNSMGVEVCGYDYNFYTCRFDETKQWGGFPVMLINNTNYNIKVDSIQIDTIGNFKTGSFYIYNYIKSDFVYKNTYGFYNFDFDFKDYGLSVGKVKFFVTEMGGEKRHFEVEGTTKINTIPSTEKAKITFKDISINNYPFVKIPSVFTVSSCSNENIILDTVYFKTENPLDKFIFTDEIKFPLKLESDSLNLYYVNIFTGDAGIRYAQICANFRNENGETFTRCLDILVQILIPSDVINPADILENISVYPNPADNYINIRSNQNENSRINNIEILDMFGRTVYNSGLVSGEEFNINTSDLIVGNYIAVTKFNDGSITRSIIRIIR